MEFYRNVEDVAATKIQRWWKSRSNITEKNEKIRSWLGSLETIYETHAPADTSVSVITVYNKFVTFFNFIKQFFVSFFTK
jgi:hypothetical protein